MELLQQESRRHRGVGPLLQPPGGLHLLQPYGWTSFLIRSDIYLGMYYSCGGLLAKCVHMNESGSADRTAANKDTTYRAF